MQTTAAEKKSLSLTHLGFYPKLLVVNSLTETGSLAPPVEAVVVSRYLQGISLHPTLLYPLTCITYGAVPVALVFPCHGVRVGR